MASAKCIAPRRYSDTKNPGETLSKSEEITLTDTFASINPLRRKKQSVYARNIVYLRRVFIPVPNDMQ